MTSSPSYPRSAAYEKASAQFWGYTDALDSATGARGTRTATSPAVPERSVMRTKLRRPVPARPGGCARPGHRRHGVDAAQDDPLAQGPRALPELLQAEQIHGG